MAMLAQIDARNKETKQEIGARMDKMDARNKKNGQKNGRKR